MVLVFEGFEFLLVVVGGGGASKTEQKCLSGGWLAEDVSCKVQTDDARRMIIEYCIFIT